MSLQKVLATILVADDEPFLRELVRTTVESDTRNIVEAADGDEAWALIKKHQPALVLLDVRMPGLNGLQLVKAIRADPELAGTRVILIAASAHESDRDAGMAAGADFYVTKPFSPAELLALVEAAMARSRLVA
ncbi:MAG TPA: response regulator [Candidatus Micrarchaeaceae archaeon]|nr:response regulator [Candidatus Micrarchaeaceae archaeon]